MLRYALTGTERRAMAGVMVVLLFAFCLAGAVPATAAVPSTAPDSGCQVSEDSSQICAKSSVSDSVSVVAQPIPAIESARACAASLPLSSVDRLAAQFHADRSAPRAPPVFLV
jgi:hypothetical protein